MVGTKRKRSQYTRKELQDVVELKLIDYGLTFTYKFFRPLVAKYAPNFAALFEGCSSTTINEKRGVTIIALHEFDLWLRVCWAQDRGTDEDTWRGHGVPDWSLLECQWGKQEFDRNGNPLSNCILEPWIRWIEMGVFMFIFADIYDIPRLRQDALDRIVWAFHPRQLEKAKIGYNANVLAATIEIAFMRTPEDSPLRGLLVDGFTLYAVNYLDPSELLNSYCTPKEFAVGVALLYHRLIEHGPPGTAEEDEDGLAPCDYHEHKTEAEKSGCKVRVFM